MEFKELIPRAGVFIMKYEANRKILDYDVKIIFSALSSGDLI